MTQHGQALILGSAYQPQLVLDPGKGIVDAHRSPQKGETGDIIDPIRHRLASVEGDELVGNTALLQGIGQVTGLDPIFMPENSYWFHGCSRPIEIRLTLTNCLFNYARQSRLARVR